MASEQVTKFTSSSWQADVLSAATPVMVDFWAEWCAPCRMLAPIVDELAAEYAGQLVVGKLNVDENPDVAGRYGIMGIPSLVVFRNGEPVERIQGFMPKRDIKQRLDRALAS